ncbi:MAG TPA: hypothetical protein VMM13_14695, partial [Euzebya sp.]|nr:hypothetical protein [Euzebya sp.]
MPTLRCRAPPRRPGRAVAALLMVALAGCTSPPAAPDAATLHPDATAIPAPPPPQPDPTGPALPTA